MNFISDYLDIIVFAAIAVVLLFRLRSVLGERSEDDVPPYAPQPTREEVEASVAALVEATRNMPQNNALQGSGDARWAQNLPNYDVVATATVHNRLTQFLTVDSTFRPDDFLDKARKAFAMIIAAYSEGNRNTLEFLLTPNLLHSFIEQINNHAEKHETFFINLHGIQKSVIADAELNGTTARVMVDFTAEQSITHKDADGNILHGGDGSRRVTRDRWVFVKDLKDASPVWLLDETRLADE